MAIDWAHQERHSSNGEPPKRVDARELLATLTTQSATALLAELRRRDGWQDCELIPEHLPGNANERGSDSIRRSVAPATSEPRRGVANGSQRTPSIGGDVWRRDAGQGSGERRADVPIVNTLSVFDSTSERGTGGTDRAY